MKKDIEWLKEEVKSLFDKAYDLGKMEYHESEESIHRINSLIDQLDEPQKPVIPQFVADWIVRQNQYEPEPVITAMNRLRNHGTRELMVWFESNPDLYARAWLDGYEVEREKKYYVLDSLDIPLLERANNQTYKTTTTLSIYEDGRDNSKFELTEQEIKDYDERYWAFAEEVTE